MSRSSMYVRFPDGVVRYGVYNNTVDAAWPPLFDDLGEAWDAWEAYYLTPIVGQPNTQWVEPDRPTSEQVDVEVYLAATAAHGYVWLQRADVGHLLGSDRAPRGRGLVDRPDWVTEVVNQANAAE